MDLNKGYTQQIISVARREGVTDRQLAYILATAAWETAHTMKPVKEAYRRSEDWRKKNLRYFPWYGRGFVQLTWEANYKRAQEELGVDLTTNPDAALNAAVAARILVRGMLRGWFTGKRLADYINDQKCDYRNARRIVNGMDRADEIRVLAQDYEAALRAEKPTGGLAALIRANLQILRSIFGGKK